MYFVAGCTKGQARVFLEEDQRLFTLQNASSARRANSTVKESGHFLVEPVRTLKDKNDHTILIVNPVKKLNDAQVGVLRGINSQVIHLRWKYSWVMNFLACLALYPVYVPVVPYEEYVKLGTEEQTLLEKIQAELGKSAEEKEEDTQAKGQLPKIQDEQDLDEDTEYIWKHCCYLGWAGMQSGLAAKSNEEAQKVWIECYEAVKAGKPVSRKVYCWAHEVLKDVLKYAKYFSVEKAPEVWQDFAGAVSRIGTPEGAFALECAMKFAKCGPKAHPYLVVNWPRSGYAIRAKAAGSMEVECMYCAGGEFQPSLDWCLKNAALCVNARIYTKTINMDKLAFADFKFPVNSKLLAYAPKDELGSKTGLKGRMKKPREKKVAEKTRDEQVTEEPKAEEPAKQPEEQGAE